MTRSSLVSILLFLAGNQLGCSDPMYPKPPLPPIVIPPYVPPAPVERSLLTILLPMSGVDNDRSNVGRVRTKTSFNFQWVSLPENRQKNGKQADAHFAGLGYHVTVFVPQQDGTELVARTASQPERQVGSDNRWSYRLALDAPDVSRIYVVRLETVEGKLSETVLEVVEGDESGR